MGDRCHGRWSQRAQRDVVQHPRRWAPHALPQWSVLPRVLAPRGVRVSRGADDRARPAISTESLVDLPSGVNLTPLTILAAQLAVVAIALGPALYLRAKARRPK